MKESMDLTIGLDQGPTMYHHDCLTGRMERVCEPLLDRIQNEILDLTRQERERLTAWLTGTPP